MVDRHSASSTMDMREQDGSLLFIVSPHVPSPHPRSSSLRFLALAYISVPHLWQGAFPWPSEFRPPDSVDSDLIPILRRCTGRLGYALRGGLGVSS